MLVSNVFQVIQPARLSLVHLVLTQYQERKMVAVSPVRSDIGAQQMQPPATWSLTSVLKDKSSDRTAKDAS
jgi:hypothetical protein